MARQTTEQLNLQVLRISGMVEVTYLVDGKEVKTSRIQQMIDNGELLALFTDSAAIYNGGNVYKAVMQFRKNLSNYRTIMNDKVKAGAYFPDYPTVCAFYNLLWDYTSVVSTELAPADSATTKYGKYQWQVTADDIDGIDDAKELQKVINSLNDVCSPGKYRPQFSEYFGEDYLVKAKDLRVAARNRMKSLVQQAKVSDALLAKLQGKGKVTLTAADLAELKNLLI